MKTNQVMQITIGNTEVIAHHKTAQFDLTSLWKAGSTYRILDGGNQANITQFLNSDKTKKFIAICEEKSNGEPQISKTGRGKNARTFVSLHLAIYAAEYLSPEFHYEVIDTFINGKILEYRDESGDNFKLLNERIDTLPDRVEKAKSNKGCYIAISKMFKAEIKPDGDSWNTASADQLRDRAKIEEKLADYIDNGFITSYPQLKEVAERLLKANT